MSNIERFWDTIIEEAAGKGAPPDLSREILAQLDAPAARNPRRGRTLLLRAGQFATAAAALFAIAWLTGLVRFDGGPGGTGIPACEDAGDPKVYAASPGAEVFERDGYVELKRGWLLVTTGAPDVVSGDSTLADVDGRVLVHAPGRPTNEQVETVTPWLNANRLETDMIKQMKAWATGATLAALVLSGSAILDGQEIEAQDEEATEEPVWHVVSSVMDIEQLPEDTTHVRGDTVKGAHLEFLAKHTDLVAIDFRDCQNLRKEHIKALQSLQALRYLDLRGTKWDDVPDYKLFGELNHLEELAVDYEPQKAAYSVKWPAGDGGSEFSIDSTMSSLADIGVRITLGNLSQVRGERLEHIVEHISTLRELDLSRNLGLQDADLELISEHPNLRSLNIIHCRNVSELGLAYLAKHNRLTSLSMNMPATSAVRHQLRKLTTLESLSFQPVDETYDAMDGGRANDFREYRASIEAISGLPNLTRVLLFHVPLPPEVAPMFREFPNADELELDWDGWSRHGIPMLAQALRAAVLSGRQELSVDLGWRHMVRERHAMRDDTAKAIQQLTDESELSRLEVVVVEVERDPDFELECEDPIFPRLFKEIGSLKQIRFVWKQPDSQAGTSMTDPTKEFASYVEKHFADFEVEIEYEVGDR